MPSHRFGIISSCQRRQILRACLRFGEPLPQSNFTFVDFVCIWSRGIQIGLEESAVICFFCSRFIFRMSFFHGLPLTIKTGHFWVHGPGPQARRLVLLARPLPVTFARMPGARFAAEQRRYWVPKISWSRHDNSNTWKFPKMGVPTNHQF